MSRLLRGRAGLLYGVRLVARIKRDKEMVNKINSILRDEDKLAVAIEILEERTGGTPIQDFITFIIENWDAIKAIIQDILDFFDGITVPV